MKRTLNNLMKTLTLASILTSAHAASAKPKVDVCRATTSIVSEYLSSQARAVRRAIQLLEATETLGQKTTKEELECTLRMVLTVQGADREKTLFELLADVEDEHKELFKSVLDTRFSPEEAKFIMREIAKANAVFEKGNG